MIQDRRAECSPAYCLADGESGPTGIPVAPVPGLREMRTGMSITYFTFGERLLTMKNVPLFFLFVCFSSIIIAGCTDDEDSTTETAQFSWIEVSSDSPWAGRSFAASLVYDNAVWLIGKSRFLLARYLAQFRWISMGTDQ
ncbi:hypothetical protein ACFL27_17905 [candidate division CSSED10-310 bacterium]|uniref:Uncharacterized protein n=1 Tax=candidate division CSSED10-310 bacterium TaxID=2855610 RepID=A0ABV6Z0V1_UNCC1